jgi:hypothetical protein
MSPSGGGDGGVGWGGEEDGVGGEGDAEEDEEEDEEAWESKRRRPGTGPLPGIAGIGDTWVPGLGAVPGPSSGTPRGMIG